MKFKIEPLGHALDQVLQEKIDNKTKPLGALGKLEDIALKIGQIQQSLEPQLCSPHLLVFAADHGIARHGVSAYPPEVTEQMVLNFLRGGAAVNVFCELHKITLKIVDAGVDADLPSHPNLTNLKIGRGTANILEGPAMTEAQCQQAIAAGAQQVRKVAAGGCNVIALGEMGIGNTSAAAMLMHVLTGIPLQECVGKGTGLDDAGVAKKLRILERARELHPLSPDDPFKVLATFGGFEIAMMCGAYLQAAENRMVILVDGFIASAALLVASKLYPEVLDYCVFTHCSSENGHKLLLQALDTKPLIDLQMRLGEGSGAAVAYPLVQAAVQFLNRMASFADAGVSRSENA
jgi:nicotinate-nucleotide--dimethylbenzimidazole phosphoribosyltransferase